MVAVAVISSEDLQDGGEHIGIVLCRYCQCRHDRVIVPEVSMQLLSR
jgi:hypothetical protein